MPLPETVRVKLSTEAAEAISITPVVVQQMAVRDLIEHMLGVTGKDEARIHELLLRGTLVSGASRLRWEGWSAEPADIRSLLSGFPDAAPDRPFTSELCIRAVLRGGRLPIEIPREAGSKRPLLRRASFWDLLMEVSESSEPQYRRYSYRDRADCYEAELSLESAERLRSAGRLLRYTTLRDQVRGAGFHAAELYVLRDAPLS